MSTKGIYTALSGAMAQNLKLDSIANNIANVNTPGFKRDQQVFREYLTAHEKPPEVIQVPKDVAAIESFYNIQGGDKSFVEGVGTFTDHGQGTVKNTGGTLDLAIDGDGFFEVLTPQGTRFTRAGNFTLDGNGTLVTKDGYFVLGQGDAGSEPQDRVIQMTGQGAITVTDGGEVLQGQEPMAKIGVVRIAEKDAIEKVGNSMYSFKNGFNPTVENLESPNLRQGFLEMSNVNVVQEMTDMITTNRVFEMAQKAIQSHDTMADKMINIVGKVQG